MATGTQKSETLSTKARVATRKRKTRSFIEEARRKQILDAAVDLFTRKGFDRTSLQEIADVVGISKGVISYHFDGKRDLGEEVIRHATRQFGRYVHARVAKKKHGKDKLLEFMNACFDYIQDHPDDYLAYTDTLRCFGTREEKREMIAWVNQSTRDVLVKLVEEGQADGSIGKVPARDIADVMQAITDGLMEQVAAQPDEVDIKGCKRLVGRMLSQAIQR